MNSKQDSGVTRDHYSKPEADGVNRRRFMGGVAIAGIATGLNTSIVRQAVASERRTNDRTSSASARLPDGSQFTFWDRPLKFSRTYYVDNASPNADDSGPGTKARPFRTIGKAAELLQPGERVVIAEGVYRECVRPARGGTGPAQMISYEAAPGAKVRIKGSQVLQEGWQRETVQYNRRGPNPQRSEAVAWRYDLTPDMFPDLYNPFALPSIMGSWGWLDPTIADMGPYLRRRGLIFVDGKPLEPMEQLAELAMPELPPMPDFTTPPKSQFGMPPRRRGGPIMQEIGGSPTARFWTHTSGTSIYIRLDSGTPADHLIEVTTREHAFIPVNSGTSFIRIKGLTFEHVGNSYPWPAAQSGMISPAGGDHWIIEDNTMEWANGMLLDLGKDAHSDGAPNPGASHIVRRNTLRYGGVEGIGGLGTSDTLIEDNLVEWCGWADAERGWEAAGCKFHFAHNMLFRRNVVRHMRHANAVWWDVGNKNCRVTQNVFADVLSVGAAVHFEMNGDQNSLDNNIVWGVRNAEAGTPGQRGAAGSAIFDNATSNLIIAQNLVGQCNNAGVFPIVRPDRDRPIADGNIVSNNIFAKCGRSAVNFLNQNNQSDGNVYVDLPKEFQGLFQGTPTPYYDPDAWTHIKLYTLDSWRAIKGWDKNSVIADADIDFDPSTLNLTIRLNKPLPRVSLVNGISSDIFGQSTGSKRTAGPLADIGVKQSWNVDPRKLS
jgi:hypothetical protein